MGTKVADILAKYTSQAQLNEYAGKNGFSAYLADNAQDVRNYGAKGDGTVDDSEAIQEALDTGKSVYVPNGVYRIDAPLTTKAVGQEIFGQSLQSAYFVTPAGSNHDILRLAQSHSKVSRIHFRPGSIENRCIRIYAGLCTVERNRFLSAGSKQGTAIVLDDVNPEDSSIVAGAYVHHIEKNYFGAAGYEWEAGIYSVCQNNGQQGTKFKGNQFMSDRPIVIEKGGGNIYEGNLFQSASGTYADPTGQAIDLNNVIGEKIHDNYFERYDYGTLIRQTSNAYQVADIYGNHYDNVTYPAYSLGAINYSIDNENVDMNFAWKWEYTSTDVMSLKNDIGAVVFQAGRANRVIKPYMLAQQPMQSISYSADGETKTPASSYVMLLGNGKHVNNAKLGNGVEDGQHLYALGMSWSVQILNDNILFNNSEASVRFGNGSTNIAFMHLIWVASVSKWVEISRNKIA